jgi:hypothetical protein
MKHGSTITHRRANAKVWNGNIRHRQPKKKKKKVQNSTVSRKSDVDSFLGFTGANFETLSREEHISKQCPLQ